MSVILGIDIGGSTTKIVGLREDRSVIAMHRVQAQDPITSLYGALGNFLFSNSLELGDVSKVVLTGVGSSFVDGNIYGIPTEKVEEFTAVGVGGLALSGEERAVVVSMGTGTSFVRVKDGVPGHLGGIGIGGGTIIGLSKMMLNTPDIDKIQEMAADGCVGKIDLRIGDISKEPLPGLDLDITASNFGKASSRATDEDKAAGIVHMVLESICQTAVLISQGTDLKDFVLIGSLTNFSELGYVCDMIKTMYPDVRFIVPEDGEFATAIGAALAECSCLKPVKKDDEAKQ